MELQRSSARGGHFSLRLPPNPSADLLRVLSTADTRTVFEGIEPLTKFADQLLPALQGVGDVLPGQLAFGDQDMKDVGTRSAVMVRGLLVFRLKQFSFEGRIL